MGQNYFVNCDYQMLDAIMYILRNVVCLPEELHLLYADYGNCLYIKVLL